LLNPADYFSDLLNVRRWLVKINYANHLAAKIGQAFPDLWLDKSAERVGTYGTRP